MKEFKVNEYLTLKLEGRKTVIYIREKPSMICKRLPLQIPENLINNYEEIDSIDEAADVYENTVKDGRLYKKSLNTLPISIEEEISPKEEFWGHCSNLQVWAENNYDTRLIHRNLAFPLLKELTDVGDPLAKKVFKEEITMRFQSDYKPVTTYLINQGYLQYLEDHELEAINIDNLLFPMDKKSTNRFSFKDDYGPLLKHLFDKRILTEGSKRVESKILSDENRSTIFRFIEKYPGANFIDLKNFLIDSNLNIGIGRLIWHLEILMMYRLISIMKFKEYTFFYPYEMTNEHAICYFLLRDGINREIIKILNDKGPMKQADIPQDINESKENVYTHIQIMVEERLLIHEKDSAADFEDFEVRLNPAKRDLLIKIIQKDQQAVA